MGYQDDVQTLAKYVTDHTIVVGTAEVIAAARRLFDSDDWPAVTDVNVIATYILDHQSVIGREEVVAAANRAIDRQATVARRRKAPKGSPPYALDDFPEPFRQFISATGMAGDIDRRWLMDAIVEYSNGGHAGVRAAMMAADTIRGAATLIEGLIERHGTPEVAVATTLEGMIESLYDLDPDGLRRLALEALLISDGPDRVSPDSDRAMLGRVTEQADVRNAARQPASGTDDEPDLVESHPASIPTNDIATGLLDGLQHLADEYGPAGVLRVAGTFGPDGKLPRSPIDDDDNPIEMTAESVGFRGYTGCPRMDLDTSREPPWPVVSSCPMTSECMAAGDCAALALRREFDRQHQEVGTTVVGGRVAVKGTAGEFIMELGRANQAALGYRNEEEIGTLREACRMACRLLGVDPQVVDDVDRPAPLKIELRNPDTPVSQALQRVPINHRLVGYEIDGLRLFLLVVPS